MPKATNRAGQGGAGAGRYLVSLILGRFKHSASRCSWAPGPAVISGHLCLAATVISYPWVPG